MLSAKIAACFKVAQALVDGDVDRVCRADVDMARELWEQDEIDGKSAPVAVPWGYFWSCVRTLEAVIEK